MKSSDEWGKDPAVQAMRRMFGRMEAAQGRLLNDTGITPFDTRLRLWRRMARALFEKAWSEAGRRGMETGEEKAAVIYLFCLAALMVRDGVDVPETALPRDPDIERLIREIDP